jgi:molybdenum cofactor synthesis domain-containing protein
MQTVAVLTVSDSAAQGKRADLSGPATAALLRQHGFGVLIQRIVADDQPAIEATLMELAEQVQLVITTGGTGIAERDVTPEATRAVCSRLVEGIPEKMRTDGLAKTPYAVLSRGICGVRGQTLILNLPGSPKGAVESLHSVIHILPHAVDLLAGKTGHGEGESTPLPPGPFDI